MKSKKEEWYDIPGYEGFYQISNKQRIRSLDRIEIRSCKFGQVTAIRRGQIRSTSNDGYGYLRLYLRKNGKSERWLVHRLVATVFVPNPENKPLINHKDGNKNNNEPDNLEWVTTQENTKHAVLNGLHSYMRGGKSAIGPDDIPNILKRIASGEKKQSIANDYEVSKDAICRIKSGETWTRIVKQWKQEHGEIPNKTWKWRTTVHI